MQLSVTFRHMEPTESLKAYARERMERIHKYLPDPISCHVVLSTERHNHRVDVNFQLHNGLTVAGHEITENMYSSIDLVIAKIERQVRKYKGKIEVQRVRPHDIEPVPWSHTIVTEGFDSTVAEAVDAKSATSSGSSDFKIVKTEKFHANPMSVEVAIVQMNLAHENFLVFRQAKSLGVAVVYRRDEGGYGVIETPN